MKWIRLALLASAGAALDVPVYLSRRQIVAIALASSSRVRAAGAAETVVRRRVNQEWAKLRRPDLGLTDDIYYPAWFLGHWNARSTTLDVAAPLGESMFGGKAAYSAARSEIGRTVTYTVHFFRNSLDAVVADRPANTKSLVAATLGDRGSFSSLPPSTRFDPNKLSFEINVGPASYSASIRAVSRFYDTIDETRFFDTTEFVRQSISSRDNPLAPSSIKDVETLCVYEKLDDATIRCEQQTATWLFPSDQRSAIAAAAADGRPIDVRTYSLEYKRLSM